MSTFNTEAIPWKNPVTDQDCEVVVQFKYGDTRQHEYCPGEELKWGGNDIGPRGARSVVVDGALEGDPPAAGVPEDFEVYVIDNRIEAVRPASGSHDFARAGETYIVLEK